MGNYPYISFFVGVSFSRLKSRRKAALYLDRDRVPQGVLKGLKDHGT